MPPSNHDLHVKLTLPQKKKISENAQAAGFNSVSDFVRHITLEEGYTMEQRIRELHEAVLGQNKLSYNHVTKPQDYNPLNQHYNSESYNQEN